MVEIVNQDPGKLTQTRCFLLDMDGTVYLGEKLLPGAQRFLDLLEQKNIQYLFLTNNSSRHARQYAGKLQRLGINAGEESIFTSGEATAMYLKREKPGARLYVVGTDALIEEMTGNGFIVTEDQIDMVVLGFDTTLTYDKLVKLCDFVRSGKPYIATHPDINCPTEHGFIPDTGSVIALVKSSTGREPDVIIGKPNQPIVDAIVDKLGIPVNQITMVGDRLYTDIAMGKTGITTALVLCGETTLEDLADSPFKPDYIVRDLAELASLLEGIGKQAISIGERPGDTV
jgi:4-nitrophenyl phosphatase